MFPKLLRPANISNLMLFSCKYRHLFLNDRLKSTIFTRLHDIRQYSAYPEPKDIPKSSSHMGRTFTEDMIDPNMIAAINKAQEKLSSTIQLLKKEKTTTTPLSSATNTNNELGELVYSGSLDRPLMIAKSLSLSSSIGGLCIYPAVFFNSDLLAADNKVIIISFSIITGLFIFITPVLMQLISKRYLIQIYYNSIKNQFTAYYKNFFLIRRKIVFTPDDVKVPPVTGIFTTCLIKQKPYFINNEDFKDKDILKKMLGYDKPFDFSPYMKAKEHENDISQEKTHIDAFDMEQNKKKNKE
ncbi:unnamed protein product [Didymodactylos carnosus]|uniref:Transmembrane protein 70 homolog, mitochondrial n=1 Tax=Didymodactylos carnosus TaxID=1234261 RepID=A0A814HW39_9BILA|nr:unnamed protein product [Didymodactylos carnosus]CAF1014725.1 unnamed protein product [Didymodactylos carnosus]CAF3539237.1 unnamed protein product [Didymodactylos carnosus]CAF3786229.1 unnamed protein product [Didymodactylos carnosus]